MNIILLVCYPIHYLLLTTMFKEITDLTGREKLLAYNMFNYNTIIFVMVLPSSFFSLNNSAYYNIYLFVFSLKSEQTDQSLFKNYTIITWVPVLTSKLCDVKPSAINILIKSIVQLVNNQMKQIE